MSFIDAFFGPSILLIDFISEVRLGISGTQVEQDDPNSSDAGTDA